MMSYRIKKSIVFMSPLPPPYMGPTIATEIILNSNLKDEFELIHLDTSDHRDLFTLGAVDFLNISLALKHYAILFWLILTRRPSLVYIPICQTTLGYLRDAGFILISKALHCRVICHLRGGNFKNWYTSSSLMTKWLVRNIHSVVDGQIVLGENLRYLFDNIIPREKIYVVPNGMDIKICFNRNKDSDKIRVLYLSNFIREKGIIDILKAIPYVYNSNKEIEFVFAGNSHDKKIAQEIRNFIYEHSSLPIKLIGPVYGQSKFNLLCSSDIFVFPTYYPLEGHPWVIVEAMAAGLPIITTDLGAITESVKEDVNGFIVEKRNPEEIAEKIVFLSNNPDLRRKMSMASRQLYLENFTEDSMVKRLTDAFRSVLAK